MYYENVIQKEIFLLLHFAKGFFHCYFKKCCIYKYEESLIVLTLLLQFPLDANLLNKKGQLKRETKLNTLWLLWYHIYLLIVHLPTIKDCLLFVRWRCR